MAQVENSVRAQTVRRGSLFIIIFFAVYISLIKSRKVMNLASLQIMPLEVDDNSSSSAY